MPTVTLEHCQEVLVWGPDPPQHDVALNLLSVGAPGDGSVSIDGAPGQLSAPYGVPTGTVGSLPISGVSEIRLHYVKGPNGPPTISVTFDVT